MSKTWEMVVRGRTTEAITLQLDGIERKNWLKLLGMAFQDDPCCWDLQVDILLSKVASRMYIQENQSDVLYASISFLLSISYTLCTFNLVIVPWDNRPGDNSLGYQWLDDLEQIDITIA
ncbi:Hypothetical predicted protein [Paramuricea clavata]|uniref:Uncharacterized protein n=1 Tax=Paramuricea clavata TaxID=317549 RepID=A0A6S7GI17_PARCT|nr:Hypothetical predicted protein [Paramuricea clavata]